MPEAYGGEDENSERLLRRPASEKPVMVLACGKAAEGATVPSVARMKKGVGDVMGVF